MLQFRCNPYNCRIKVVAFQKGPVIRATIGGCGGLRFIAVTKDAGWRSEFKVVLLGTILPVLRVVSPGSNGITSAFEPEGHA